MMLTVDDEMAHEDPRTCFDLDVDEDTTTRVAVVAVRARGTVREVYSGEGESRRIAKQLATGARASREFRRNTVHWHYRSSGQSSGVARFCTEKGRRVATVVVCEGADKIQAFATAQKVAAQGQLSLTTEPATRGLCCDCSKRLGLSKLACCPVCSAPCCSSCLRGLLRACSNCVKRAELRETALQVDIEKLGEAFGDVALGGQITKHEFGKLLCAAAGVEDDDDPAFERDFDAADKDGDGFLDFHDVVDWLKRASLDEDALVRSDFAAWPSLDSDAKFQGIDVDLRLERGRLRLKMKSNERVALVHPSVFAVQRVSPVELQVCKPSQGLEETLSLEFPTESKCREALAALSETLAVCRRLKAPMVPFADMKVVDRDLPVEALAWTQVFRGHVKEKRKSVAFSDADEIEVSRGWAFDSVKGEDGWRWEAAAPRRAKELYRAVVKLVIRPPRAEYSMAELGPRAFDVAHVKCVRSDFDVTSDGKLVSCSFWKRVDSKKSTPCVVYAHGNASCRLEALSHVAPLLLLGINVCALDSTGSGHSDGEFVTLGQREAADVAAVARRLIADRRAQTIALMGRSMGGVAALLAAARYGNFHAKCVVADSPFASLNLLVSSLARSAAYNAFSAPLPDDLSDAQGPVPPEFVRRPHIASFHAKKKDEATDFWSKLLDAFPGNFSNARGALAEAAAKAALASVKTEVEKRAAFSMDDVDCLKAIDTLDLPMCVVAAEDDALVPVKPNACTLVKKYAVRSVGKAHLESQLIVVHGGHNAKRNSFANRKIYQFLCRHLLPELRDKSLRDHVGHVVSKYADLINAAAPPWKYTAVKPDAENTPDFVSGMTDARFRRATKDISNFFNANC